MSRTEGVWRRAHPHELVYLRDNVWVKTTHRGWRLLPASYWCPSVQGAVPSRDQLPCHPHQMHSCTRQHHEELLYLAWLLVGIWIQWPSARWWSLMKWEGNTDQSRDDDHACSLCQSVKDTWQKWSLQTIPHLKMCEGRAIATATVPILFRESSMKIEQGAG